VKTVEIKMMEKRVVLNPPEERKSAYAKRSLQPQQKLNLLLSLSKN